MRFTVNRPKELTLSIDGVIPGAVPGTDIKPSIIEYPTGVQTSFPFFKIISLQRIDLGKMTDGTQFPEETN